MSNKNLYLPSKAHGWEFIANRSKLLQVQKFKTKTRDGSVVLSWMRMMIGLENFTFAEKSDLSCLGWVVWDPVGWWRGGTLDSAGSFSQICPTIKLIDSNWPVLDEDGGDESSLKMHIAEGEDEKADDNTTAAGASPRNKLPLVQIFILDKTRAARDSNKEDHHQWHFIDTPSHTNTHTHTRAHTQHFWMDMTVLWFQGLGPPLSTRFSNTRWEAFHQNYGDDHVVMRVMIVRKADCNTGWHVISQGARLRNDITSKTIACLRVMPFYYYYIILFTITYRILLLCIWVA